MIFDGFGTIEDDTPFYPSEDSFSACIFVKDQNHELVEWIAYYYQTFSLEYLVIGVDEESTTTPHHVVDRWKSRIKTVIWGQNMFAPKDKMPDGIGNMNARHSRKEKLFFKECIKHLKLEGRKWTLFVEPNEFITFRYPSMSTTPDEVKQDYQRILIPKMRERGVIRKFLAQEASKGGILSRPCITIPRLLFIGKETSFLDPMNLNTLRYSAHGKRDVIIDNGLAKNILDVSRVPLESLDKIRNAHSMIKGVCEDPQLLMIDSLFQVNRYLGSYESYHRSREIQSGGGPGGQDAVRGPKLFAPFALNTLSIVVRITADILPLSHSPFLSMINLQSLKIESMTTFGHGLTDLSLVSMMPLI